MAAIQTQSRKEPSPKELSFKELAIPPHFDFAQYGITVADIRRNLSPAELYKEAILQDAQCDIADTGALISISGEETGRSPKDKRVVENLESKDEIWWGPVNVPIDNETFDINRERAIDYLNTRQLRSAPIAGFRYWSCWITSGDSTPMAASGIGRRDAEQTWWADGQNSPAVFHPARLTK